MANNVFKKYYARIAREGVMKAVLLSGGIALGALAVTVLISWFTGFKAGLWLGLGIFAALLAGLTPLFYIKLYRPTAKAIAKRVDKLGLEERVLTMVELENDTSYVALKQREDTMNALSTVNHMLVKLSFSAGLIISFSVALVLGASSLTVGSLYVADVIPSGVELIEGSKTLETYTVSYWVSSEGGTIVKYTDDWENTDPVPEEITVTEGEDAPFAVLAVEDETHIFVGWTDGVTDAYRHDLNVKKDIDVAAVFLKYSESYTDAQAPQFNMPDIDSRPHNDNDLPPDPDAPPTPSENSSGNGNGTGNGGSGASDPGNQIIDGDTYYGDSYDQDHSSANDRLGSDDSMGEDLKGGINDYFDSLQPGSTTGGSGDGSGDSGLGGDGEIGG